VDENKQLARNLHAARKEVEQLREELQNASLAQVYMEELKAAILGEVSTLRETM